MVANADLERDHLFRQNVQPTQTTLPIQFQNFVLFIKRAYRGEGTNLWRDPIANSLVTPSAGLWTCVASSNAVVANTSDNWQVAADIVNASSGNRSWIVLQSPAGSLPGSRYIQMLIACDRGVVGALVATPRFAWATDLNPFNVASPSLTAAPTATITAENSLATDHQIVNSTFGAHTISAKRTEVGDVEIYISQDGTGLIEYVLRTAFLLDYFSADNYPVMFGTQRQTTGDGGFANEGLWNSTTISGGAGTHGFFIDGTVIDNQVLNIKGNSSTLAGSTAAATGDGISHDFKGFPIFINSNATAARNGLRGRIPDLWLKYPTAVVSNTLEPGSDAIRRICAGDFVVLTDGATQYNT